MSQMWRKVVLDCTRAQKHSQHDNDQQRTCIYSGFVTGDRLSMCKASLQHNIMKRRLLQVFREHV